MNKTDFPRFSVLMKAMNETYGNNLNPVSKEKAEVYFRVMEDMSIEQVEQAVYRLIRDRKITSTFPVPGEIREFASEGSAAILALDKLEKAIGKHGSYASVIFDDPVIHMVVVSMGGWPRVCCPSLYGDEQEWVWKQKEFVKLYDAFSKNHRAECPPVLFGIADIENSASGRIEWMGKPRIVGNAQKALEWTEARKQLVQDGTKHIVAAIASKMKMEK